MHTQGLIDRYFSIFYKMAKQSKIWQFTLLVVGLKWLPERELYDRI